MQKDAQEAIRENGSNKNIAVDVDGTLQKQGYSPLNGVVTATEIDTGKAIDGKFYLSTVDAIIKVLIKKTISAILKVPVGQWMLKVLQENFNVH
ncbi:hypothetical protein NPIL_21611 [Nephila pilipes]|uniref:Uncharacterized protein n=1 Tax=Nephila pilipes TaxID=299642 RepID=A0A8X6U6Y3_NEPPI|nr:hypothetical protein NPIL_21611 [Nephila pilipes]